MVYRVAHKSLDTRYWTRCLECQGTCAPLCITWYNTLRPGLATRFVQPLTDWPFYTPVMLQFTLARFWTCEMALVRVKSNWATGRAQSLPSHNAVFFHKTSRVIPENIVENMRQPSLYFSRDPLRNLQSEITVQYAVFFNNRTLFALGSGCWKAVFSASHRINSACLSSLQYNLWKD